MSETLTPARAFIDQTEATEPDEITVGELREVLPTLRGDGKPRWHANPVDVEHDNTYRASRAADAVLAYADKHDNVEELHALVSDLLSDLMHLAQAAGQPWWRLLATAQENYDEELRGV